jgi:hypothetical protein
LFTLSREGLALSFPVASRTRFRVFAVLVFSASRYSFHGILS